MGDISTRASSVGILARDLEAQSQTTGFESRQTASQKLVNREIGLNQKDTQVRNVSEVPTSEFYKAFISYHHPNPDKGPHHCLFICWGPPGSQWAIDIPVINLDDEVQIFKDIRNYWFKHRGQWRRLLPFYGVLAVKEVKVSIFFTKQVINLLCTLIVPLCASTRNSICRPSQTYRGKDRATTARAGDPNTRR